VKASAGGGGKGMRVLRDLQDAAEMIAAARREAQAAFGDGTLYVERLIERPRHVEIQVFGDGHGNVVHLFERECSVQRRHQKVIEESPCPVLTPSVRSAMGEAAVAAARAVGYRNAGTVEFLLEGGGDAARFYFLEMNTRLQVEHPVTEAVTGVDLVRAQLAVAAGAPLPWTQESLSQRGHAIECRVYAEDAANGFLPQAGPLLLYREPAGPGVRVDAGVIEGSTVPVHYDPLLAKLIVHAETREIAIARARVALQSYPVLGIRTNIPFLIRILEHQAFTDSRVHTTFVDAHLDELLPDLVTPAEAVAIAAMAAAPVAGAGGAAAVVPDPWGDAVRLGTLMAGRTLRLRDERGEYTAKVENGHVVVNDGDPIPVDGDASGMVRVGAHRRRAWAAAAGDARWVFVDGQVYVFDAAGPGARRRAGSHQGTLSAPMPATVLRIQAAPGDAVSRGDVLIVLEAMKMELPVRAPSDGVVSSVNCQVGELVQPGTVLIEVDGPKAGG
nr:3-methylcrotonyl-CoA carboxylase [Acidobacteriota bacterium]